MNRRIRATAALFAIVAMLFAPLAMALHACPGVVDMVMAADAADAATASLDDDSASPMPADPALCERHCNTAKSSFDLAKPPCCAVAPMVPAMRVAALEPLPIRKPAFDSPFSIGQGPAPPLIRFTVLRH